MKRKEDFTGSAVPQLMNTSHSFVSAIGWFSFCITAFKDPVETVLLCC